MNIPGENLSKVHHYYVVPPLFRDGRGGDRRQELGGHSGAGAVAEWRAGHADLPRPEIPPHVKYWIKPDIENRIKNGEIKAYFESNVVEVTPDTVVVETPEGRAMLRNDFVFAMTGYHPDFDFLEGLGVRFEGPTGCRFAMRRRWRAMCPASTWPG